MKVRYAVDGHWLDADVEGECLRGDGRVLAREDQDIVLGTPWAQDGFTVAPLLPPAMQEELVQGLAALILGLLDSRLPPDRASLEALHRHCGSDQGHLRLIEAMRHGFPLERLPVDYRALDRRISELCGTTLSCANAARLAANRFCLRIVRPGRQDFNPPHRDVWLDRLRQAVNIYVPIAGSNAQSSLPLLPGSHLWPECDSERTADGARVNGVSYSVPSVVSSVHGLAMRRPAVAEGEVLLFSPYLVHGGAANLNADTTRVSLEMRFWRA